MPGTCFKHVLTIIETCFEHVLTIVETGFNHERPPIGKIAAHSAYDMFHGIST